MSYLGSKKQCTEALSEAGNTVPCSISEFREAANTVNSSISALSEAGNTVNSSISEFPVSRVCKSMLASWH